MNAEKILTYTVLFDRSPEGNYVASVPSLPGCFTQGKTFEAAKANVKKAIAGYLSVLKEDGDQIPVESVEHIAATVSVSFA